MASADSKIAIVGMACRFPGGAHNPEVFWELLLRGACTMEDVPSSRFNIDDYWSNKSGDFNKMEARQGHFLQEGTLFDEGFFNISPREARNIDPQHRVLLETVVDGLDDAGYKACEEGGESGWDKSRMGVFIGIANTSYENNLASEPIGAFFSPGTIGAFASGRISHHFGWQGPSIVYDTACSSSLVSVHSACQSLLLRDCDSAVAGGSNMITSPEMYLALSKGFFISNTGGCRTFDETADGYCRGEGVGVVILKRFEDALRDKDKIHAVIVASGVNHSGPSESLTTPHSPSQAALFSANCQRAGISPLAVRVIEAHGTGTSAGDCAEIEAIKTAYCQGRTSLSDSCLLVSSLKPNVGHSESAAGITSLIKAVLMVKHRQIPPHLGITTRRNPRLGDLEAAGIIIPSVCQSLEPVSGQEHIFTAVHSFGAQGGNASLIIQDTIMPEGTLDLTSDSRTYHVVTLSAKSHTPLSTVIGRLLAYLEAAGPISISSLSYTSTARRIDYTSRLALSVSSIKELKQQLQTYPVTVTPTIPLRNGGNPKVGFVIGGNGTQFQGMGRGLYETSPVFRSHIEACNVAAMEAGIDSLIGVISGNVNPLSDDLASEIASAVGIFSVGYALGMMWQDWGIKPVLIMGHSLGEYAGLALAGSISLVDSIKLLVAKFESVHSSSHTRNGGMLAIGMSADHSQKLIDLSGCSGVTLACINGPSQTVVSGPKSEILKLQLFIEALPQPPLVKLLPGAVAWHSSHLVESAKSIRSIADKVCFQKAKVPMLLNVDGSLLNRGATLPSSYLTEQMTHSVRFDLCATHTSAREVDIWIELSAKTILLPLLRSFVPTSTLVSSFGSSTADCWRFITKALARLYEAHVHIDWAAFHRPYLLNLVSLPSYPFARNEHWVAYSDRLSKATISSAVNPDFAFTPLGLLQVKVPWKHYMLHYTNDGYFTHAEFMWLAFSCTQSKHILDLEVLHAIEKETYLEIVVKGEVDLDISFYSRRGPSEASLLVASCKALLHSSKHYQSAKYGFVECRRSMLDHDSASSFFNKRVILKLLETSKVDNVESSHLEHLAIGENGKEALGSLLWEQRDRAERHPALSNLPWKPADIYAFLQPASILSFLESPIRPLRISFVKLMHANNHVLSFDQNLSVHVFSDSMNAKMQVLQTYVYAQDSSPIICISSLSSLLPVKTTTLKEHPSVPVAETAAISPLPAYQFPVSHLEQSLPTLSSVVTSPSSATSSLTLVTPRDSSIIEVLGQELGISQSNIMLDDVIEEIGVDSIMWHLLRDRLYAKNTCSCKWPVWKKGMTVKDLCDLGQSHADGICFLTPSGN